MLNFTPEKTVQTLMKERREKVEEVKKKTNYYSTRDLIQRYDETSPATPLQLRVNPSQPLPVTPQQQQPFPNNMNSNGKAVNPALQAQLSRASILLPFVSDLFTFFFIPQLSLLSSRNLNDDNGMID
jgi:endoplasmic reticulum junction formation protein lunapark